MCPIRSPATSPSWAESSCHRRVRIRGWTDRGRRLTHSDGTASRDSRPTTLAVRCAVDPSLAKVLGSAGSPTNYSAPIPPAGQRIARRLIILPHNPACRDPVLIPSGSREPLLRPPPCQSTAEPGFRDQQLDSAPVWPLRRLTRRPARSMLRHAPQSMCVTSVGGDCGMPSPPD